MLRSNFLPSAYLGRHPPAGRPVPLGALTTRENSVPVFTVPTELFDSGTSALAVALKRAVEIAQDVPPIVSLPAYACPNLVAATLWAGATPSYYDLSPDSFGPDESSSVKLCGSSGVILIVDAFGARSLDASLSQIPRLQEHRHQLVHDLAQSYAPYLASWRPYATQTVVSFGKAKPTSLTVGGALLTSSAFETQAAPVDVGVRDISDAQFALRASIYRQSLRPYGFGLLSRAPGLGIGKTQYSDLKSVSRLPRRWQGRVAAAALDTRTRLGLIQADTDVMIDLAIRAGAKVPQVALESLGRLPLWRVPVLCTSSRVAHSLSQRGSHLGVSRLYGRSLPEILGLTRKEAELNWPNAVSVAERLITLPTHGRLSLADLRHLEALLREGS